MCLNQSFQKKNNGNIYMNVEYNKDLHDKDVGFSKIL